MGWLPLKLDGHIAPALCATANVSSGGAQGPWLCVPCASCGMAGSRAALLACWAAAVCGI